MVRNFRQLSVKCERIAKKGENKTPRFTGWVASTATIRNHPSGGCPSITPRFANRPGSSNLRRAEDAIEGPDRVVAAGLRFGVRRREIVVEPGDRRVHVPRWRVFSRMSEISSIWATQRWALEPANPTQLAETVAYLLGNAHRCGVADECVRARRNSDSRLDRCRRSGFC